VDPHRPTSEQWINTVELERGGYHEPGNPDWDSIAFQRVDANTLKATAKKGGQVAAGDTLTVSKDGQTTTIDYVETDTQGKKVKGTAVLRARSSTPRDPCLLGSER
jgi:hypothetical protein